MPSAVLIVNRASGFHLTSGEAPDEIAGSLRAAGIDVTVLEGDVGEQIAKSRESDADMVIVDGGDGTINAVITAHAGGGRPVGIIPGGTMNLLATDFGIPVDRAAAVQVIASGKTRPIDAGAIDGHLFLHTALTGLPVRIGVHREHRRGRLTIFDKVWLGVHALATLGRDPKLKLTLDGKDTASLESGTFAFLVGTLKEGQILPRPVRRLSSGKLTALSLHPKSGLDLARIVVRGAFGDLVTDPDVDALVMERANLSGLRRKSHAMLDGESVFLKLPSVIEVRPAAIEVFGSPDD
ncbi:diacylglycerol kinase family protein [Acuticoccus sp. MNP-M23]|uniref:diacylglycerol/lipid kinase family protein n=1 Tax=Acuticoccus sp. MNP-M23 TaxID=3072793 RepID=UPI002814C902|nr:diacylglycerol kinase family protein [Acuticoccus sp. MNP-M23]WMS44474.1 diacylglycerol kinase family protein [Acuticoccus sp. MNP-M23]